MNNIEKYNKTLEQKVEERTKELADANKALIEFTYIVSHDLQEPLRKITTFGELLKKNYTSLSNEQIIDYINRMQNSSKRMKNLINDLLSYSRLTTNKKPFETVDLNQIINNAISDLEVSLEQTGGSIKVDKLPFVEADSTQMQQLFLNLLGNALKFHKPEISPIIKVYSINSSITSHTIIIEDNGIGINNNNFDRIFGVFQRLHGKNAYVGSGIGLAICKKIIDSHNGSITIQSEVGIGTKFILNFNIDSSNKSNFE